MSNNSTKVKDAVKTLSVHIGEVLDKCEKNDSSLELNHFLREIQKELNRQIRAFDTKRFFVVTIGALKAGKSTLINALTGYRVSPDGTGAETTKKCSIIMSADEEHREGITLYRYTKATSREMDEKERYATCKAATRYLMDYFKGNSDWNDKNSDFERKFILNEHRIDPTRSNLDYILTSSDFSELQDFRDFMLAEIRIKTEPDKRSVLSEKVAIIDMPGLDGLLAGVDSNDVNPAGNPVNFLPLYSHLFLLVQSSISGLNRTTASKLKEWKAEKKSTPVYLVFNVIDSKSEWHNPKSVDEEKQKRQREAENEMKHQGIHYNNFYTINAAKAWESCCDEDYKNSWRDDLELTADKLRKDSKIDDLIGALLNNFNQHKDRIIQEDAVNGVNNALNRFVEQADKLERTAIEDHNRLCDECIFWDKIIELLKVCNTEINRKGIETSLGKEWDEKVEGVSAWIKNEKEKWANYKWIYDDADQNTQFENLAKHIHDCIKNSHNEKGFSDILDKKMKESFIGFYNKFNDKLEDLKKDNPQYKEYVDSLKENLRRFEQWKDSRSELEDIFSQPSLEDYKNLKKLPSRLLPPLYKFRMKNFVGQFIEDSVKKYVNDLTTRIRSDLTKYCINSEDGQDNKCLFNRRVNEVKDFLEITIKNRKDKINVAKTRDLNIIDIIPNLRDQIKPVDRACAEFQNTISI